MFIFLLKYYSYILVFPNEISSLDTSIEWVYEQHYITFLVEPSKLEAYNGIFCFFLGDYSIGFVLPYNYLNLHLQLHTQSYSNSKFTHPTMLHSSSLEGGGGGGGLRFWKGGGCSQCVPNVFLKLIPIKHHSLSRIL